MPEPTVNPQSIQPTLEMISTELQGLGVHQIASFAWRDLDDPDAGGSEVHADQVFPLGEHRPAHHASNIKCIRHSRV